MIINDNLRCTEDDDFSKALGAAVLAAIHQGREITTQTLIEILSESQPGRSPSLWPDDRDRAEALSFFRQFTELTPPGPLN